MHPHILITDAGLEERDRPQSFVDQLTLFQSGWADFLSHTTTPPPRFSDVPTTLRGGGDPKSDSHEWTPHTISLFFPFRATFLALSRVIESDQAGKTKAKHEGMDVGRSENLGGGLEVIWGGGHYLLFLAEIGLSDLPKSGGVPPCPRFWHPWKVGVPKYLVNHISRSPERSSTNKKCHFRDLLVECIFLKRKRKKVKENQEEGWHYKSRQSK